MKKMLVAALAVPILSFGTVARAIEEPRFVVSGTLDGVELRDYAPFVVAEVLVPGPASDAGSQAFGTLAGYIFGKNKGERKLPMTAPVTQSVAPQKIEMTAPVTQSATQGGYWVRFVMPATFTLETLPEPDDPKIRLTQIPSTRYAVIKYSGFWSQGNYDDHLAALRKTLAAAAIESIGEPIYARYDPPWTPWFLRRNEIWLQIP